MLGLGGLRASRFHLDGVATDSVAAGSVAKSVKIMVERFSIAATSLVEAASSPLSRELRAGA
jgi:hypothetical protein